MGCAHKFLRFCVTSLGFPLTIEKCFIVRLRGYKTVFVQIAIAAASFVEPLRAFTDLDTLFTQRVNFDDNFIY